MWQGLVILIEDFVVTCSSFRQMLGSYYGSVLLHSYRFIMHVICLLLIHLMPFALYSWFYYLKLPFSVTNHAESSKAHCRNLRCIPKLRGSGIDLIAPQCRILYTMVCHCTSLPNPLMRIACKYAFFYQFNIFSGRSNELLTCEIFYCLNQPVS
jgi:hypothetical protein